MAGDEPYTQVGEMFHHIFSNTESNITFLKTRDKIREKVCRKHFVDAVHNQIATLCYNINHSTQQ
jgi:hypothetical protein